ncbi:MAG: hypothetical protein ACP5MD_14715, partial [Verrucomicrobiia bacterium]
ACFRRRETKSGAKSLSTGEQRVSHCPMQCGWSAIGLREVAVQSVVNQSGPRGKAPVDVLA